MSKFINKILRIAGALGLFCLLSYAFNQYLFNRIGPNLAADAKIVSCGVSMSQFALSDSLIRDFENLSVKGRSGLGVYKTAKMLVQHNPQIEYLVMDFSILGMALYRDYKFFLPVFAPNEFYNVYPLTTWRDLSAYPLNYKYYIKNQMRYEWVPNLEYIEAALASSFSFFDADLPYLGHFDPHYGTHLDNLDEWKNRLKQMQRLSGETAPMSKIDISYTDSIAQFAEREKIGLVIFCPPVHADAQGILPEPYHDAFAHFIHQAESRGHQVFDFTDFALADSLFFNHTHVNAEGAAVISRAFQDSLEQLIVNSTDGTE